MSRHSLLWICAALVAGCAASPPRRDLLGDLERRVLPNGLAVVVKEDRRLPTVTAMLAYRVGSVNEDPGITGASHFFEHMVFKGTRKYKRGDIDLVTYRCGGENNAFTTHDMTGYWFHVGSRHLDEVLDILADTMGNCTLDPAEFDLERNTVLQEMNIWLDGPWGELERDLETTVYRESSYRHPVLGFREDVQKLTRDRMMEYYKAYYKPNNASLVVVGDVPAAEVFRKAERFFGSIPRGKDAVPPRATEPPQKEERTVLKKTDRVSDRLIVAFRTDRAGTDTDIALDVIATILGEGRTSRLQKRLVEHEDLAGEGKVDVFNYSRKHEGIFTVQAELAVGDAPAERARDVVVDELEALKLRPVGDKELVRAKNILRAKFAFEAESQYELTSKIGYFEALGLPDYVARYMERVEAVTPAGIQEVARRIFTPSNRTVAMGHAKGKRKALGLRPWALGNHGALGNQRATGRRLQASGGAPVLRDVREVVLENGLTVVAHRRSDVPVVSIQAHVEAGALYEPEGKAGLSRLTGELLDEGIDDGAGRKRTGEQLAEAIEYVGGEFGVSATGASVKVLSDHAPLAFDLLRDVLRHPSFPEDRVEKLREDMLAEIEARDDDPQEVAERLFYENAYKGHPYHRPDVGYAPTVEKLTRDDVVAHYRAFFRPENTIIAVAGDLTLERAVEEVRARFGTWKGMGPWTAPRPPPAARQPEPRRVNFTYASQQARIFLGHVAVARADPDYFALRVAETILGSSPGFTNRLARNVRDVHGLAYDIYGAITAGSGAVAGAFQVVLGVEAKDKDRGLQVVMDELRAFVEAGPTAEEVEDARRYLLASFVSAWETTEDVTSYLLSLRRFGLGADYAGRFHRQVAAVTPEEVRRAARKHLDLGALTVVVVGPVDKDGNLLKDGERKK